MLGVAWIQPNLNRTTITYITFLATVAAGLLVVTATHLQRSDALPLILFALTAVAFDLYEVQVLRGISFSLASGVFIMALLTQGTAFAVWAAAIAELTIHFKESWRPTRAAFNVSQVVIRLTLVGAAFGLMGGVTGPAFAQPLQALAACVADVVINIALLCLLFSFRDGRPVLTVVRQASWWYTSELNFVGKALGIVAAIFWHQGGLPYVTVLVVILSLLQFSLQRYVAALNSATSRGEQLEAVLNATKSAIIMVDHNRVVRLANQTYGEMFGLEPTQLVGRSVETVPQTQLLNELESAKAAVSGAIGNESSAVLQFGETVRRFLNWYRAPVLSPDGRAEGIVEVFTDVTLEKAAEERLRRMHQGMLQALTAAIDARDPYTHGHSARVSQYARIIGQHMGLPDERLEVLGYSGLLHDIGKLGIDDRVLRKHGPLSPSERALMMEHPVIGARVLESAGVFKELIPGVRWHHEWLNGGGYPDGLSREDIPVEARVISVADAFDAMTTDRPYRPALDAHEAVSRVLASRDVQFDVHCAEALVAAVASGEIVVRPNAVADPEHRRGAEDTYPGMIKPHHGKELSILYQISQENYTRLNLQSLLRRFLEILRDTLGHHAYGIALLEPGDRLVVHSAIGTREEMGGTRLMTGAPVDAALGGKTVVIRDAQSAGPQPLLRPDSRCILASPLHWNEESIGVLIVESPMPGFFSRDDLTLFEALAQQISSAVELARFHERVAFAATHDGLTGTYNHSHFYERLTTEVARAKRYRHPVSLIIADLNGLKAINDTYGHLTGDRVIQEYARLLTRSMRDVDIVARYGGDEFAIIMPETTRVQATKAMDRLGRSAHTVVDVDGRVVPLPGASYGLSCFPEDGERATELVAAADRAMYLNKPPDRQLGNALR